MDLWTSGIDVDGNPASALAALQALHQQQQHQAPPQPSAQNDDRGHAAGFANVPEESEVWDASLAPADAGDGDGDGDSDGDTIIHVDGGDVDSDRGGDGDGEDDSDGGGEQGNDSEVEEPDVYSQVMELYTSHHLSNSAMEDIVRLLNSNSGNTEVLPTFKTMKSKELLDIPQINIDFEFLDLDTSQIVLKAKQDCIPRKFREDTTKYKMRYSLTSVSFADTVNFHKSRHGAINEVVISSDNLPINNSGGRSFDLLSVEFTGCRTVYPLRIFQPFLPIKFDVLKNLGQVLEEIKATGITVRAVVADLPKKASLLGIKQCGAYFSCFHCEIRGAHSAEAGTVVYSLTETAPRRTHEKMLETANNPDFSAMCKNPDIWEEVLLGMNSRSPLLDLPNFDIIENSPTDHMHNLHLGVARRLFSRTFQVSAGRIRGFNRRRQSVEEFDEAFRKCKVPGEQTRKPRTFSPFWKASEFRCLTIMHFPIILAVLEHHPDNESDLLRDIWCLLSYIAHIVVRDEVPPLSLSPQNAMDAFCKVYEQYLGQHQLHYNVHLFKHTLAVHEKFGSLCTVSAYSSEAMYQELLKSFAAGTNSVGKQAMNNLFLKYKSQRHKCQRDLQFRTAETRRTADNHIYIQNHKVFQICEVRKQSRELVGVQVVGSPYIHHLNCGSIVDFSELGVTKPPFRTLSHRETIPFSRVEGKAIREESYMVCVPKIVLRENTF